MIARTSIVEAVELGRAELDAALELLRQLETDDWARPTDCADWTVRDVVAHMVGQFEGAARPDRMLRRIRAAKRMPGVSVLDGHNRLQVAERAAVPPAELVRQLDHWGRRGITAFGRIPAPLRRLRLSRLFPEAREMVEDSLDYLIRVIGPRDPWMHRIDIASAVGRRVEPGAHDASIVEQVVRDFAQAWAGPPVRLVLDGPAGGKWVAGLGEARPCAKPSSGPAAEGAAGGRAVARVGEARPCAGPSSGPVAGVGVAVAELRADAIEFCRHVSGRPAATPTVTGEAALASRLLAQRVVF